MPFCSELAALFWPTYGRLFFLCGFPVGGSVKNHRTIEFLSNFLEFFGDFLEFLGKIVGFLLSFQ